jgi:hypothetical protein
MYVTVTTTSNERDRMRCARREILANEHLDTYLSHNETCRRFILGAVKQLKAGDC